MFLKVCLDEIFQKDFFLIFLPLKLVLRPCCQADLEPSVLNTLRIHFFEILV